MAIVPKALLGFVLILGAAACDDAARPTAALATPDGPASRNWVSVMDPIAKTLTTDRVGSTVAGVPITITASFSTPGSYYVYWSARQCIHIPEQPDIWIHCSDLFPVAEGWDLNTHTFTAQSHDVEFDLHVEARELPAGYSTTANTVHIDGPAIWAYAFGPDYGNPWAFSCDRLGDSSFPFQEWAVVGGQWTATGREYRRSGCDGSRQYNPTKPDTITRPRT